uniref:Uncharacterized protein n=1 Tax=Catharus ustulatus TaxID=91951 RepID=A0A8C3UD94_CATUS
IWFLLAVLCSKPTSPTALPTAPSQAHTTCYSSKEVNPSNVRALAEPSFTETEVCSLCLQGDIADENQNARTDKRNFKKHFLLLGIWGALTVAFYNCSLGI